MLTPKDIQNAQFANSVRGYSRREVDEFLDQITIDFQTLFEENRKLSAEVGELRHQMEEQKNSETSVINTLKQAKRLMSDISESAEKRAKVIIQNALQEAQQIKQNARNSVADYADESHQLELRVNAFRDRYKQFLTEELSRVDSSVDELFEDFKSDFYPDLIPENGVPDTVPQPVNSQDIFSPEDRGPARTDSTPIIMDRSEVEGLAEKSRIPVEGVKSPEEASADILRQIDMELEKAKNKGDGDRAFRQNSGFDERARTIVVNPGDLKQNL